MKNILLALILLCSASFLTPSEPSKATAISERPVMNLPASLRQSNWSGSNGQGSCVHATVTSLLRWQGRLKTAEHWRTTYGNGEDPNGLAAKMEHEGIRYAYVTNGDVKFLEWAMRTRRGCGVTVQGGAHFVALVSLDAREACILDNNDTNNYHWMPRETFLSEWHNSEGWACSILYAPTAPLTN